LGPRHATGQKVAAWTYEGEGTLAGVLLCPIHEAAARPIISAAINDDRREGGEHVAKGRNMQKEKKKPKKAKK